MKIIRWSALIVFSGYGQIALGQDNSSHVLGQLAALMPLMESLAYLIGLVLVGAGLYKAYKNPQNPQQHTIGSAVRYMLSGTLLLSITTVFNVLTRTTVDPTWTDSGRAMLALDQRALQDFETASNSQVLGGLMPESLGAIVLGFVYLVGFIAIIRGVFLMKEVGQMGGQNQAGIGKVMTHLIGGVIAMNLTQSACIMASTFSQNSTGFC